MKRYLWVVVALTLITLHQPNGTPVYVNTDSIEYIGPSEKNNIGAKSKLLVYGLWMWFQETPKEVLDIINKKS